MSIKIHITPVQREALQRFYPTARNGRQMIEFPNKSTVRIYGHKDHVLNELDNALVHASATPDSLFIRRVREKVEAC